MKTQLRKQAIWGIFVVLVSIEAQPAPAQDPSIKPDPIAMTGRVVDADGKPVENATVDT